MRAATRDIPVLKNPQRFISKTAVQPNGCWLWVSAIGVGGYGVFYLQGQTYKAHRVSYDYYKNKLDPDKFLDHTCRTRLCVNPDHLREVDRRTNMFENSEANAYLNSIKTHCKRGHEFTKTNTYLNPEKQRICRVCKREKEKGRVRDRSKKSKSFACKFM